MTWHPDIPLEYRNSIVTGDARILAERIPDESVDLIFTDPVYESMDDYRWLGQTAARVLTPRGMVLACFGIGYLPETIAALNYARLKYRWTLGAFQPNGPSRRGVAHGFSKWWGCLWFDRDGNSLPPGHFPDMVESIAGGERWGSDGHQWRKNPAPFVSWLRAFTLPNSIVADFFAGGGTVPSVCKQLNRNYIAFEIDPNTAEKARERVANTQTPLFTVESEQLEFDMQNMHEGD